MKHVIDVRRPEGPRSRGEYEAIHHGEVIARGRYPVALAAKALIDTGLASPDDSIIARRLGTWTKRGNVGMLARRLRQ